MAAINYQTPREELKDMFTPFLNVLKVADRLIMRDYERSNLLRVGDLSDRENSREKLKDYLYFTGIGLFDGILATTGFYALSKFLE